MDKNEVQSCLSDIIERVQNINIHVDDLSEEQLDRLLDFDAIKEIDETFEAIVISIEDESIINEDLD